MMLDKDVSVLMDVMYFITMLLPIVPDGMVKRFEEIFDGFIRINEFTFTSKGVWFITHHV